MIKIIESDSNIIKFNNAYSNKLIYSDDNWKIYHITTYESSEYYGKNTKWRISGNRVLSKDDNCRAYFNSYIRKGVEFYFYINSNNRKYAMALYPNGSYELFDSKDKKISGIPNAPDVDGLPDVSCEPVAINGDKLVRCIDLEIESYKIPYGVTKICDRAFTFCTSLKSIIICNSIKEIGDGAFDLCNSLESVNIPNSVTEIGDYAFSYCTSLKSVAIPDSIKKIGDSAFRGCPNLIVYCNKGSHAEQYCIDNGMDYISK